MSEIPALDPEALSKILAKSVLELVDVEVDQLIAGLRAERAAYIAAESAGKKKAPSAITKAANKVDSSLVSFDDILGDITP